MKNRLTIAIFIATGNVFENFLLTWRKFDDHLKTPITAARIFITGSADGLGQLTAKLLADQGHQVVLHARNAERGQDALKNVPNAETVVTGDLSSIEETKQVAHKVNSLGA